MIFERTRTTSRENIRTLRTFFLTRILHFTALNTKTCVRQMYPVQVLEMLLLFFKIPNCHGNKHGERGVQQEAECDVFNMGEVSLPDFCLVL